MFVVRYLQGMHEYEVELQFTSGLLGQPDRTHDEADVIDGNEPVFAPDIDAGDGEGLFSSTGDMRPLLSASSSNSEYVSTGRELDSMQVTYSILLPLYSLHDKLSFKLREHCLVK